MSKSVSRSLAIIGLVASATVGLASPGAAVELDGAQGYEITSGSSPGVSGVVTARVTGDSVEIAVAAANLGVEEVVMHFHEGTTCDAGGAVVIPVPSGADRQSSPGGTLRLVTTEPLGSAELDNIYFNFHEAGNLTNVVGCATLAEINPYEYQQASGPATSLTVTNSIVGATMQTKIEASGLTSDTVVMHFHEGSTCDAGGAIVLGTGGPVPTDNGNLDLLFLNDVPAGFEDPGNVYFNVHNGDDLSDILACGLYSESNLLANAETLDDITGASDYDVETDPEVLRLYQAFFNREPDVAGAIYWIGIRDTYSALEIAGAFPSASAEFQNTYGDAADNTEFLTRVYRNVLGREPDPAGFEYWLDILNGTNTTGKNTALAQGDRGEVVFFVAINDEFVNNFPYLP